MGEAYAALPLAINASGWALLAVLVMLVFATAYALYTRQGSGISNHPVDDTGPAEHPDREDEEALGQPGIDESEGGSELDQRGTDSTGS